MSEEVGEVVGIVAQGHFESIAGFWSEWLCESEERGVVSVDGFTIPDSPAGVGIVIESAGDFVITLFKTSFRADEFEGARYLAVTEERDLDSGEEKVSAV